MAVQGSRILKARKRRGLTQRELADALGVTVQAISQWEHNKTDPSSRVVRLAEVLRCSPDYLRGDKDLLEEEDSSNVAQARVPVIDESEIIYYMFYTGENKHLNKNDTVETNIKPLGRLFAIRVKLNSDHFSAGDILIFDTGVEALEGDHAAIVVLTKPFMRLIENSPATDDAFRNDTYSTIVKVTKDDGDGALPFREAVILRSPSDDIVDGPEATLVIATMVEHRRFRRRSGH